MHKTLVYNSEFVTRPCPPVYVYVQRIYRSRRYDRNTAVYTLSGMWAPPTSTSIVVGERSSCSVHLRCYVSMPGFKFWILP